MQTVVCWGQLRGCRLALSKLHRVSPRVCQLVVAELGRDHPLAGGAVALRVARLVVAEVGQGDQVEVDFHAGN